MSLKRASRMARMESVNGKKTESRMEVRSPERLVGIDIPNAGDAALIEKCPLQAAGVSREDRPKQIRSEVRRKRFGAIVEKAWTITRVEACCGYAIIAASNQGEAAECPHIAVTQVAPVAEREHHANVWIERHLCRKNQQLPCHP